MGEHVSEQNAVSYASCAHECARAKRTVGVRTSKQIACAVVPSCWLLLFMPCTSGMRVGVTENVKAVQICLPDYIVESRTQTSASGDANPMQYVSAA